jgi:hypothetical protein
MNTEQMKLHWQQRAASETAPFGYDEFLTRVATRANEQHRRRKVGVGFAATLFLLMGFAFLWRAQQAPLAPVVAQHALATEAAGTAPHAWGPAVVSADTYLAVTALEDRLAWFDDALSEARVNSSRETSGNVAHVRELEFERDRLAQSLVQVRYAAELSAAVY